MKEAVLLLTTRYGRATMRTVGAVALAGGILVGAAATAAAEPPPEPPNPPPCTAAELARVMSGVSFDVSNYLSTHPDVNAFFTSLKGQPREQIRDQLQSYADANPQVRADLQAIRQPAVDFRQRCG
jgi:hemophore-related protein